MAEHEIPNWPGGRARSELAASLAEAAVTVETGFRNNSENMRSDEKDREAAESITPATKRQIARGLGYDDSTIVDLLKQTVVALDRNAAIIPVLEKVSDIIARDQVSRDRLAKVGERFLDLLQSRTGRVFIAIFGAVALGGAARMVGVDVASLAPLFFAIAKLMGIPVLVGA